jgi:HNH endonuclease
MSFPDKVKEEAMVACRRQCCLCHRLKHTLMECHHIVPQADGGDDTFENCIPLCLECHGEVMSYNPKHPIGTRYSPNELKRRRDEWYQALKNPTVTVLNQKHINIDRELVKHLRNTCPPHVMKHLYCDRDYENPFEKLALDALGILDDFAKRTESHFLDPTLEALFAEFNARVRDMKRSLDGIDIFQKQEEMIWFPKPYVSSPDIYAKNLEERQTLVTQARDAARKLYESYAQLIHECRLKLEISTLDEL